MTLHFCYTYYNVVFVVRFSFRVASTNCDLITQILTLQVGNNGTCWRRGLLTGAVVCILTFIDVVYICCVLFCR